MELIWIALGFIAVAFVLGLLVGTRSRDTKAGTAGLLGLFLGLMAAFPLLAIGLANIS